jgi:hypothetical protein
LLTQNAIYWSADFQFSSNHFTLSRGNMVVFASGQRHEFFSGRIEKYIWASADHSLSIALVAIVVVSLPFREYLHMRRGSEIGFLHLSESALVETGMMHKFTSSTV